MTTVVQQWTESKQETIRANLRTMLASPLFAGSPRQARFLDYLVTHTLAGNADRLKGYTIALEVFDRKNDFDPSLDAIVRVEATRLRNKLREYYDTLGQANDVRIEFPKGSYTLEFNFLNQNATEIIAGELAIKPTSAMPRMIEDKPSLVVLPFANIGTDNAKEYFADGVVDSLISMFSRLSGLFIISRQSAFAYKSSSKTSKEIATELGVRYLLEGSVQHAGDQVRIHAQLVDTQDNAQVWSERYDRELKDIFALQDELTQSIVNVLQIKLAGAEAALFGYKGVSSIEAHDTLLQGIAQFRKYTEKSTSEALVLLIKAVALDPNYAAAQAWLARVITFQLAMVWNNDAAILEQALVHAERAIELDPQSPYAMSILGWVQLWRKNREESIVDCRRAVTLDPNNAEAHLFLSLALSSAGLGEEAIYYIEKARKFTPTPAALYDFALGNALYMLKNYEKAIVAFEQGCQLYPSFIPSHYTQMLAYEQLGMEAEVFKKFKIICALTVGQPQGAYVIPIWTDKALAEEQEAIARNIHARYA